MNWETEPPFNISGIGWCSWFRRCVTSRKVAGSIPDGVNGIFHSYKPFVRNMALGLTQPLTEISTRNISWGLRCPMPRADNLTTFMCQLSWNLEALTFRNLMGLSGHVMGLLYFLSLGALQIVNVDLDSLSLYLLISATAQFWVSDHQKLWNIILHGIFCY